MNIREKLLAIQTELHAPKSQYNAFGKYKYRNCEDILEAVKPLCKKHGAVLTISDELYNIGQNYYIQAHATLENTEKEENSSGKMMVSAFAKEADIQKGMNPAQITGSTSSYARKYALNGLFCIDDTKDDDFHNHPKPNPTAISVNKKGDPIIKPAPVAPSFLKGMAKAKAIIIEKTGDADMYYSTLEDNGYKKSNQVEKKDQDDMLSIFRSVIKNLPKGE